MPDLIARLFDPVFRLLTLLGGLGRLGGMTTHPGVNASRHLLVTRNALPTELVPRPAAGPYSQAAYERWERAASRFDHSPEVR